GVLVALFALLFGIFAPVVTRLMLATPKAFIATLAGLALLRVLERGFVVSFKGGFTLGATVCFLVTVANVPILSIGAPFWAVLNRLCRVLGAGTQRFQAVAGSARLTEIKDHAAAAD